MELFAAIVGTGVPVAAVELREDELPEQPAASIKTMIKSKVSEKLWSLRKRYPCR
jgi:hypothetical protein